MMQAITRREWLLILASVAAAPASLLGAVLQRPEEHLRAWVDAHVPDALLNDLARAFLRQNPDERAESLARAVLDGWRPGTPLDAHVADLVRRDFEAGWLEDLDGWLLTRTEARLLALAVS